MIKVISQTTAEREKETRQLFNKVKPYLDNGLTYTKALRIVLNCTKETGFSQRAWFKDLIEYGETQGYPHSVYSGKGLKKRVAHV